MKYASLIFGLVLAIGGLNAISHPHEMTVWANNTYYGSNSVSQTLSDATVVKIGYALVVLGIIVIALGFKVSSRLIPPDKTPVSANDDHSIPE